MQQMQKMNSECVNNSKTFLSNPSYDIEDSTHLSESSTRLKWISCNTPW